MQTTNSSLTEAFSTPDAPRRIVGEGIALYIGITLLVFGSTTFSHLTEGVDPHVFIAKTIVSGIAVAFWATFRYWSHTGEFAGEGQWGYILDRYAPIAIVILTVLAGLALTVDTTLAWHAYEAQPEAIEVTTDQSCRSHECGTLV